MAVQSENICKEIFAAGNLRIEVHMDSEALREDLTQIIAASLIDSYEITLMLIKELNEDDHPDHEYLTKLRERLDALDLVIAFYTSPQQYIEWKTTNKYKPEYYYDKKPSEDIKCTYVDG